MTKEDIKKFMPLMQAMLEGKTIQRHLDDMGWVYTDKIFVGDGVSSYRIKPEPRYRPFKTQEECVKEMINHTPFGIITDGVRDFEVAIYPNGIYMIDSLSGSYTQSFSIVLKECKFADGTPFGIKEEWLAD